MSETAESLYALLGITFDGRAASVTLDADGEETLIWLFSHQPGHVATLDPDLLDARALAFRIDLTFEEIVP